MASGKIAHICGVFIIISTLLRAHYASGQTCLPSLLRGFPNYSQNSQNNDEQAYNPDRISLEEFVQSYFQEESTMAAEEIIADLKNNVVITVDGKMPREIDPEAVLTGVSRDLLLQTLMATGEKPLDPTVDNFETVLANTARLLATTNRDLILASDYVKQAPRSCNECDQDAPYCVEMTKPPENKYKKEKSKTYSSWFMETVPLVKRIKQKFAPEQGAQQLRVCCRKSSS